MKKLLIIFMAAAFCAVAASSRIMWSITAPGESTPCGWLIGTMHTFGGDDMPQYITDVIDSAETVVVEVNDDDLSMGQRLNDIILAPADSTLTRLLTPAQLDSLAAITDTVLGITRDSDMWQILSLLKPAILSTRLAVALMPHHSDGARQPVDLWIRDRAAAAGAEIVGLETAEQQMTMIMGRPIAEQTADLIDCMRHIDSMRITGYELELAYISGDIAYIEALCDDSSAWLVEERNRVWLPRITAILERSARTVIAVGAAHIVGPDGLARALTDLGFTVRFIPADTTGCDNQSD